MIKQSMVALFRTIDGACAEMNKMLSVVAMALGLLVLVQIVQIDLKALTVAFESPTTQADANTPLPPDAAGVLWH